MFSYTSSFSFDPDWPLVPNSTLWSFDPYLPWPVKTGFVGSNGLLTFPLDNQVMSECFNQASGLGFGFQTMNHSTCRSWTTSNSSVEERGNPNTSYY